MGVVFVVFCGGLVYECIVEDCDGTPVIGECDAGVACTLGEVHDSVDVVFEAVFVLFGGCFGLFWLGCVALPFGVRTVDSCVGEVDVCDFDDVSRKRDIFDSKEVIGAGREDNLCEVAEECRVGASDGLVGDRVLHPFGVAVLVLDGVDFWVADEIVDGESVWFVCVGLGEHGVPFCVTTRFSVAFDVCLSNYDEAIRSPANNLTIPHA